METDKNTDPGDMEDPFHTNNGGRLTSQTDQRVKENETKGMRQQKFLKLTRDGMTNECVTMYVLRENTPGENICKTQQTT